jgi:hypothetical protein
MKLKNGGQHSDETELNKTSIQPLLSPAAGKVNPNHAEMPEV